jgi:hypothetical protein
VRAGDIVFKVMLSAESVSHKFRDSSNGFLGFSAIAQAKLLYVGWCEDVFRNPVARSLTHVDELLSGIVFSGSRPKMRMKVIEANLFVL